MIGNEPVETAGRPGKRKRRRDVDPAIYGQHRRLGRLLHHHHHHGQA